MYLYLVQHAEALSKEEDPTRSLSEKGIADIRKVAGFVKKMNLTVHRIVHSGKMRALQTAQLLEERVSVDMGIAESDGLAPMDDPGIWVERLSKINDNIMLVGHLPHLGKLSSFLLCGNKDRNIVDFEMGCIVCLKRSDEGDWSTDWIIKPRMIL
jgi:phosphohistidine phosphatase